MRREQYRRSRPAQTIEPGQRSRPHHGILRCQRLIQCDHRGRRQVQRIAQRDEAAFRSRDYLSALWLRRAPSDLQQLGHARALFSDHADDDSRRSHRRESIQRRQSDVTELDGHLGIRIAACPTSITA
jgi:hypothetical protein